MIKYTNLPDNKQRIYGGAYSVHDAELIITRNKLICDFTLLDLADSNIAETIKSEFLNTYRSWLFQGFDFKHTDLYQYACFTQGTTEAFAQFYIRYREGYRLRLKRADYFYHQMMKSLWYEEKFAWLDQDEIRTGDVVMLSLPFSDTGDCPADLDAILDACERLGVPVMLDLAYLNLSTGKSFPYTIDLSRDCVKYVVTSLSKVFPLENMRVGMRLQKEQYEDQLYVVNETNYNYINVLSAFVGLHMMRTYPSDYMFARYRQSQLELCTKLDLVPSPCFVFGIDQKNQYPEYNRGGSTNRLCFSRLWDGRAQKLSGAN